MKYPTVAGFVGVDGEPVRLDPGTGWADDHPLVKAYPDLFKGKAPEGVEPEKKPRRVGRPRKPTATPSAEPTPPEPTQPASPRPSGLSTFPSRTQRP